MPDYTKIVETMECDYFFQLPPKQILEHCLSFVLMDLRNDGCGLAILEEKLNAVWMLSHMRYTQTAPACADDVLTYRTYPRITERHRYVFQVDILREDECIIRFEAAFIPVHKEKRQILRLNLLEPLWNTADRPAPADMLPLRSLRPHCEFQPCGSDTVRLSDCDKNRHMTSGAYLSMACNALGYWNSDTPRPIRMMQVDFSREVYPGTVLHFEQSEADGLHYVRGINPEGMPAFTAVCDF